MPPARCSPTRSTRWPTRHRSLTTSTSASLCGAFALIDTLASVIAHGADPDHLDRWADEQRRIFLEIASPAATRLKQTVYDADARAGHETIEAFRRMMADPPALRERLMFPTKLKSVTPSLSER